MGSKGFIIKGARVIDPSSGIDGDYDVIVTKGVIEGVVAAGGNAAAEKGAEVIDAAGLVVIPGLVDVHTHLREPGFEYKETIDSGARAAAAGGFTTILCMANTEPINDNGSITRFILDSAASAPVNVLPVGALSPGLGGEGITEFAELKGAGAVAVSDDGMPVLSGALMRRALEYSRVFGLTVISHAEDPTIAAGGVMNEGEVSTRLGLSGVPDAAEIAMVGRDLELAVLTHARLHIAHVSTAGAVELIRAAKKRGESVTAEATPHHLVLDHNAVMGYDTNAKVSPPLRSPEDVQALREGLADGTIDTIATDHAPHSSIEKDVEFDAAAFGMVGLETALGLVLGLVEEGVIGLGDAVKAMTVNPARAMGLGCGTLAEGSPADITLIDLERSWIVDPAAFRSKSRNTPFGGRKMKGAVVRTIVNGKTVFEAD